MISLYKLEVFEAVVETGSFSAAADRLFISQPAVSQHIHDLEASFGVRLFDRRARGVTPTAQGHVLHGYARQIFALLAEAENALVDVENIQTGAAAIAATPGVSVYLLPDQVSAFRAQFPRLAVSLRTGITPQVIADVLGHHADLGIIEGELEVHPPPRLGVLPLEEVEQFVVVGPNHSWWERVQVKLAEIGGQSLIVRPPRSQSRIWLDAVLNQHGLHPQIAGEFDNLEAIKRALMTGTCLAILPAYVVADDLDMGLLRAIPFENKPLQRTLKLLWDLERPFSPVTRALLRHLTTTFARLATLPLSVPTQTGSAERR